MEKSLSDGLLSRGVDLANYSPSTPSKETKPVDDTKQEIKTAGSEEAVAVESSPQGFNIVLDEGLDEDLTSNTQGEMASTHSLEDFETQESDILAKPEVSIFKQLSNRYFLNYNRIFEKKSE